MKTFIYRLLVVACVLLWAAPAWAQVAYDACSESHTGTTGSTSEASFSWNHTPVGTPRGVIVFTSTLLDAVDRTTGVTYGGTAMTAVTGGTAVIDASEDFVVKAYVLGASVATGTQAVVVSRTNNATPMYAVACTVTASADTEVYEAGIVLLQEATAALSEQAVTDGGAAVNSVRFAMIGSGSNSVEPAGANSTATLDIDIGGQTAALVRETTAGTGSRSVGFSSAPPSVHAVVHLAIREVAGAAATPCTLLLLGAGPCE